MNKNQKSLIDFMKTGEIEIELRHLPQKQLIRLVEEQQQRIDKAIEWVNKNRYYFPSPDKLLSILRGEDNE